MLMIVIMVMWWSVYVQGPFVLEDCLAREDWDDFDKLVSHLQRCNAIAERERIPAAGQP